MIVLRSAAFNLAFAGLTAATLILGMPVLLMSRVSSMALSRLWARSVVASLRIFAGVRFELRGDASALQEAALVASKHQSAFDTLIFYLIARDPAYVLKRELQKIPIYGWFIRHQGMIPIDRQGRASALRGMVADAERVLAEGRQVIIFPEGTRVAPGETAAYHPGIAALYLQLDRPVVPVALNSGVLWGRRSFLKRPGTIVVEILPPIPAALPRRSFMAELERRIETASRRLEAEAAAELSP